MRIAFLHFRSYICMGRRQLYRYSHMEVQVREVGE